MPDYLRMALATLFVAVTGQAATAMPSRADTMLHRMGNNRPHPHPGKTAGKTLLCLNDFSVRL